MSVKRLSISGWLLFIAAGLLSLAYTWLGSIGFWFVGHSRMAITDYMLLYQPLLAFPIFMVGIASLRAAVVAMWIYVTATYMLYLIASWPQISPEIFTSRADWGLLAATVCLQMSLVLGQKRRPSGL